MQSELKARLDKKRDITQAKGRLLVGRSKRVLEGSHVRLAAKSSNEREADVLQRNTRRKLTTEGDGLVGFKILRGIFPLEIVDRRLSAEEAGLKRDGESVVRADRAEVPESDDPATAVCFIFLIGGNLNVILL